MKGLQNESFMEIRAFMEIINGNHLWKSFMEIIYGNYLWK